MNTLRTNSEFLGTIEFDDSTIRCYSAFDMMSRIRCVLEESSDTPVTAVIYSKGYKLIWSSETFVGSFASKENLHKMSRLFNFAFGLRGKIEENQDGTFTYQIKVRRKMCSIIIDIQNQSFTILSIDEYIGNKIASWLSRKK